MIGAYKVCPLGVKQVSIKPCSESFRVTVLDEKRASPVQTGPAATIWRYHELLSESVMRSVMRGSAHSVDRTTNLTHLNDDTGTDSLRLRPQLRILDAGLKSTETGYVLLDGCL